MKPSPPPGSLLGDTPFLWTMLFDSVGVGASAPPADTPQIPVAGGGLIWAHVNSADLRGRRWIEALEIVPAEARALLCGPPTSQRLHADGGALWGAMVDYAQDFGQDIDQDAPSAQDVTQLRFVAGPGYLITTRRRPSRSAAAVRHLIVSGKRFANSFELVDAIVDRSVQAMDAAIERLAEDLNDVEDRVLDDETRDERHRLGVLRRALIRVHREIGGSLRMVARFDPLGLSGPEAQAVVQKLALRLDGCNQEVQATEQRARLLQDEIESKISSDTNRQLYILTILSTLLMPPTLVSGIFGMNVKGLPFTDEPGAGFVYAISACVIAALLAWGMLWTLERRRPTTLDQPAVRRRKGAAPPAPPDDG